MNTKHEKIASAAVDYGRVGLRLAIKAGILYIILTGLGLVLGGIGGYWGVAHFGYAAWLCVAGALAGVAVGGVGGFFLAQIVIIGVVEDMLLDAGIRTGKTGYRAAMKLLRERNSDVTPEV